MLKKIRLLSSEKLNDFLPIVFFFFGLWTIPFWYPFILQFSIDTLLWVFHIKVDTVIIRDIFIYFYSILNILLGFSLRKEPEWYVVLLSFLSVLVGIFSFILLVFFI